MFDGLGPLPGVFESHMAEKEDVQWIAVRGMSD